MLLIDTYTHPKGINPPKHSLYVVHNERIIREYRKITTATLEGLLKDYQNHSLKIFKNVAKARDL